MESSFFYKQISRAKDSPYKKLLAIKCKEIEDNVDDFLINKISFILLNKIREIPQDFLLSYSGKDYFYYFLNYEPRKDDSRKIKQAFIYFFYILEQNDIDINIYEDSGIDEYTYLEGFNLLKKIIIYDLLKEKVNKDLSSDSELSFSIKNIADVISKFDIKQTAEEYRILKDTPGYNNFISYPFANNSDKLMQCWLMHVAYILSTYNDYNLSTRYTKEFQKEECQKVNELLQNLLSKSVNKSSIKSVAK